MKKYIYSLLLLLMTLHTWASKGVESPSKFLNYPIGKHFTYHHRMVDYFHYLERESPNLVLKHYGKSLENRPLLLSFISSEDNIANLDAIIEHHVEITNSPTLEKAKNDKVFVWLSYNIHGSESVSSEVAMQAAYELLENDDFKQVLEDVIVIIDPCLNPDGRERYVNWYNQKYWSGGNANPDSWDHYEPWPGGRFNHYLFDLNRDWLWQVQHESKVRLTEYLSILPHIHIDFHETGYTTPYFFAPGAKPYHEVMTPFQRSFQQTMGEHLAETFDENGWLYMQGEVFDLFCPIFGDTWPMFHGAMGFTYEKGGSGYVGLQVKRTKGDTLTLYERFEQHLGSSLTSVQAAYAHKDKLKANFADYYNYYPVEGKPKTYVVKNTNRHRISDLAEFLSLQGVEYETAVIKTSLEGYDYFTKTSRRFTVEPGDIIVNANQKHHRMVQVLFDPDVHLEDSLTYDLTAWQLPYIYHLQAYATKTELQGKAFTDYELKNISISDSAYAYIFKYNSMNQARLLGALLNNEIHCRYATDDFTYGGITYKPGSIVVTRFDNRLNWDNCMKKLTELAKQERVECQPIFSGSPDNGFNIGSSHFKYIDTPKIALLGGKGTSSSKFGAVWHFLEEELNYPLTIISTDYFSEVDLNVYDKLIIPPGNYDEIVMLVKLKGYLEAGGKLILLENAIETVMGDNASGMEKELNNQIKSQGRSMSRPSSRRERVSYSPSSSIYRAELNPKHPYSYGIGDFAYVYKLNSKPLPKLANTTVAQFGSSPLVSGFSGYYAMQQLQHTMFIGTERFGKGEIVYISDNPVFRGISYDGKMLMSNIVFF